MFSPASFPLRPSRQNLRVNQIELIERARRACEEVGRGMVVKLVEDQQPRYVPIEEAKANLVEQGVEPDLLSAVIHAVRKYDTRWQAVLFLELEECCTVSIVGYGRSEVVGSMSWTPVH